MDALNKARTLLQRTEAELRKIVSDAATTGDYVSVLQIASWASVLSEIVGKASPQKVDVMTQLTGQPSAGTNVRASRSVRPTSSRNKSIYPQFFRQGDRLVRVAWSKRDKKEYEHKAPLAVLTALGIIMTKKGANGRVFSTDELLPLIDDDGAEFPSYQVYVGIALLKQFGLLDQHGRRGYSIPRLKEFKGAIEAVWQNLPEK